MAIQGSKSGGAGSGTKPSKKKGSNSGSLRAEEFRNPSLAMYEMYSPSRAPGSTTQATTTGAGSTPSKPSAGGNAGAGYGSMLEALKKLSAMSRQGINQSMDSLTQTLQQQSNPFANFQAQQTQTTPDLAGLLQSQGVSADPLQQYASAINAQNAGQATAFQNLANTLGGFQQQNMQGALADVGQQRADLMNQLQGNIFGTGAQLMGQKNVDRNAIVQMLLAAMKNRA